MDKKLELEEKKELLIKTLDEIKIIEREENLDRKTVEYDKNIHSPYAIALLKQQIKKLKIETCGFKVIKGDNLKTKTKTKSKPNLEVIEECNLLEFKRPKKEDIPLYERLDIDILTEIEDAVLEFNQVLDYSKDVLTKEQLLLTHQRFLDKINKILE